MLITLLLLLNALVAIALVGTILLQRSEAGLGGAFGGGPNAGSGGGNRNPLVKVSTYLAIIFMGSCLLLAVLSQGGGKSTSLLENAEADLADVMEEIEAETPPAVPDLPAPVVE